MTVEILLKGKPPKGISGKYHLVTTANSFVTVINFDGVLFNSFILEMYFIYHRNISIILD